MIYKKILVNFCLWLIHLLSTAYYSPQRLLTIGVLAMLSKEKLAELKIKEAKLKEDCRRNLKSQKKLKWVWLHIKNTTEVENDIKR